MQNATQMTSCARCGKPPVDALAVLREVIDQTIRDLDSEVTAPRIVDDGGVLRSLAEIAVRRLRAARAVA